MQLDQNYNSNILEPFIERQSIQICLEDLLGWKKKEQYRYQVLACSLHTFILIGTCYQMDSLVCFLYLQSQNPKKAKYRIVDKFIQWKIEIVNQTTVVIYGRRVQSKQWTFIVWNLQNGVITQNKFGNLHANGQHVELYSFQQSHIVCVVEKVYHQRVQHEIGSSLYVQDNLQALKLFIYQLYGQQTKGVWIFNKKQIKLQQFGYKQIEIKQASNRSSIMKINNMNKLALANNRLLWTERRIQYTVYEIVTEQQGVSKKVQINAETINLKPQIQTKASKMQMPFKMPMQAMQAIVDIWEIQADVYYLKIQKQYANDCMQIIWEHKHKKSRQPLYLPQNSDGNPFHKFENIQFLNNIRKIDFNVSKKLKPTNFYYVVHSQQHQRIVGKLCPKLTTDMSIVNGSTIGQKQGVIKNKNEGTNYQIGNYIPLSVATVFLLTQLVPHCEEDLLCFAVQLLTPL